MLCECSRLAGNILVMHMLTLDPKLTVVAKSQEGPTEGQLGLTCDLHP